MAETVEMEERSMITDSTVIISTDNASFASVPLSELIDEVRYLQLENSDSAMLSAPVNVKYQNGTFYVSDIDERLYCFDNDGHFLRKAYKKGKGHGEVVRMYDFDVDNDYLYILDGSKSAIIKYDHKGNFIKDDKLPFRAIRFSLTSEGFVFQLAPFSLNNEDENNQIVITDKEYLLQNSFIRYHVPAWNPVSRTPFFFRANDKVIFAPIYGRSIFSIDGKNDYDMIYYVDSKSPYYEPAKHIDGAKEAMEKGIIYTYDNPIYNGKYIIQTFTTSPSQKQTLLINSDSNEYAFFNSLVQDCPLVYDFNFLLTKSFSNELQSFIGFSNSYYPDTHEKDIEEIKQSKPDTIASILIKEGISFADNPLLIIYSLKENIQLNR